MTDEQIMGINLPTGIPFVYELDENLKPVVSMQVGNFVPFELSQHFIFVIEKTL